MAREIDGPRIGPVAGGPATSLVVILHGYGADGTDLIALGEAWSERLPHAAFVAPDAPEPCVHLPGGRQWFGLTFRDPSEYWRGVTTARPALDAFLDAELKRHGLDDGRLALVGFSQGTMMALHTGLRRKAPPAAILGYSGMLAGPERLSEITARPPIQLIHGDRDDVIPVGMMSIAVTALSGAGLKVQSHVSHGVTHSIGDDGLELGARFLEAALG
jgi:phospholipase/carboxylesterase